MITEGWVEGVQHRLVPGSIDLVYGSPRFDPVVRRRSVQIPSRVANHARNGAASVSASLKTMENRLIPAGVQLEHGTGTQGAAILGGPIKIAIRIADHGRHGLGPVVSLKAVQDGLISARVKLEHATSASRAAARRGPIQISRRVANQSGLWLEPVHGAGEGVEYRLVSQRIQLVDYSGAIRAARKTPPHKRSPPSLEPTPPPATRRPPRP